MSARAIRLALVAVLAVVWAGGCTFGFGSPYVGQWRAREVVEFEFCVEDDAGRCADKTAVTRHQPARRFWGVSMSYPMIGVSFPSIDGESQTAFRAEMTIEYFRGKGRLAWGLRQSAILDAGSDFFITAPLMLMGHFGISDRLAAYGGLGYSWYNSYQRDDGNDMGTTFVSRAGGRALAGLQIVGNRSHRNSRILYSVEADTMLSSIEGMSYRSFGLTLSIGLFF